MKLSKDEQARLDALLAKEKSEEGLTDEEKSELKTLQEKAKKKDPDNDPDPDPNKDQDGDKYKGPLTQEAFDKIFAESKRNRKRATDLKNEKEALERKAAEDAGNFEDLYKQEVKARQADAEELEMYRTQASKRWDRIKDELPPKIQAAFDMDADDPKAIASNLAKFDEWQELGLLDHGKGSGGNPPSGGYEKLYWEDLHADESLSRKVKKENPTLWRKLYENFQSGIRKPIK